jgi:hypothetical protein
VRHQQDFRVFDSLVRDQEVESGLETVFRVTHAKFRYERTRPSIVISRLPPKPPAKFLNGLAGSYSTAKAEKPADSTN